MIYKSISNFKVESIQIFHNFDRSTRDLVFVISKKSLLILKLDMVSRDPSRTQEETFILKSEIKQYFLEQSILRGNFLFYFVDSKTDFYLLSLEVTATQMESSLKDLFELPIEVQSLSILMLKKLANYFVFMLYDPFHLQIHICSVASNFPYNIHSFFPFQVSRTTLYHEIFDTSCDNQVILLSNHLSCFDELTLNKGAVLQVALDHSQYFDFDLYVVARNNYFSRRIQLIQSRDKSLFWVVFGRWLEFKQAQYVFLGVVLCLFLLLFYHVVGKKMIFLYFLNSDKRRLERGK